MGRKTANKLKDTSSVVIYRISLYQKREKKVSNVKLLHFFQQIFFVIKTRESFPPSSLAFPMILKLTYVFGKGGGEGEF